MDKAEYIAELQLLYKQAKDTGRFTDAINILQEIWERSLEKEDSSSPVPIAVPERPLEA